MQANSSKLQYPRHKTLIGVQNCDGCGKKNETTFVSVPNELYKGYNMCDSTSCQDKIQNWMEATTITIEKLKGEFGPWVYIRRTSGKLESEWNIASSAYREEDDGPFWVTVRKRHRSKCVTLTELRKWNSFPYTPN